MRCDYLVVVELDGKEIKRSPNAMTKDEAKLMHSAMVSAYIWSEAVVKTIKVGNKQ